MSTRAELINKYRAKFKAEPDKYVLEAIDARVKREASAPAPKPAVQKPTVAKKPAARTTGKKQSTWTPAVAMPPSYMDASRPAQDPVTGLPSYLESTERGAKGKTFDQRGKSTAPVKPRSNWKVFGPGGFPVDVNTGQPLRDALGDNAVNEAKAMAESAYRGERYISSQQARSGYVMGGPGGMPVPTNLTPEQKVKLDTLLSDPEEVANLQAHAANKGMLMLAPLAAAASPTLTGLGFGAMGVKGLYESSRAGTLLENPISTGMSGLMALGIIPAVGNVAGRIRGSANKLTSLLPQPEPAITPETVVEAPVRRHPMAGKIRVGEGEWHDTPPSSSITVPPEPLAGKPYVAYESPKTGAKMHGEVINDIGPMVVVKSSTGKIELVAKSRVFDVAEQAAQETGLLPQPEPTRRIAAEEATPTRSDFMENPVYQERTWDDNTPHQPGDRVVVSDRGGKTYARWRGQKGTVESIDAGGANANSDSWYNVRLDDGTVITGFEENFQRIPPEPVVPQVSARDAAFADLGETPVPVVKKPRAPRKPKTVVEESVVEEPVVTPPVVEPEPVAPAGEPVVRPVEVERPAATEFKGTMLPEVGDQVRLTESGPAYTVSNVTNTKRKSSFTLKDAQGREQTVPPTTPWIKVETGYATRPTAPYSQQVRGILNNYHSFKPPTYGNMRMTAKQAEALRKAGITTDEHMSAARQAIEGYDKALREGFAYDPPTGKHGVSPVPGTPANYLGSATPDSYFGGEVNGRKWYGNRNMAVEGDAPSGYEVKPAPLGDIVPSTWGEPVRPVVSHVDKGELYTILSDGTVVDTRMLDALISHTQGATLHIADVKTGKAIVAVKGKKPVGILMTRYAPEVPEIVASIDRIQKGAPAPPTPTVGKPVVKKPSTRKPKTAPVVKKPRANVKAEREAARQQAITKLRETVDAQEAGADTWYPPQTTEVINGRQYLVNTHEIMREAGATSTGANRVGKPAPVEPAKPVETVKAGKPEYGDVIERGAGYEIVDRTPEGYGPETTEPGGRKQWHGTIEERAHMASLQESEMMLRAHPNDWMTAGLTRDVQKNRTWLEENSPRWVEEQADRAFWREEYATNPTASESSARAPRKKPSTRKPKTAPVETPKLKAEAPTPAPKVEGTATWDEPHRTPAVAEPRIEPETTPLALDTEPHRTPTESSASGSEKQYRVRYNTHKYSDLSDPARADSRLVRAADEESALEVVRSSEMFGKRYTGMVHEAVEVPLTAKRTPPFEVLETPSGDWWVRDTRGQGTLIRTLPYKEAVELARKKNLNEGFSSSPPVRTMNGKPPTPSTSAATPKVEGTGATAPAQVGSSSDVFARDEIVVSKQRKTTRKRANGTDGTLTTEVEAPLRVRIGDDRARIENTGRLRAEVKGHLEFSTGKAPSKNEPVWSVWDSDHNLIASKLTYNAAVEAAKDYVYSANPKTPTTTPSTSAATPKVEGTGATVEAIRARYLAEHKPVGEIVSNHHRDNIGNWVYEETRTPIYEISAPRKGGSTSEGSWHIDYKVPAVFGKEPLATRTISFFTKAKAQAWIDEVTRQSTPSTRAATPKGKPKAGDTATEAAKRAEIQERRAGLLDDVASDLNRPNMGLPVDQLPKLARYLATFAEEGVLNLKKGSRQLAEILDDLAKRGRKITQADIRAAWKAHGEEAVAWHREYNAGTASPAPTPKGKSKAEGTELHAGVNPVAMVQRADNLDIPQGSFTVERPKANAPSRDFDLRDRFLQPIGIYDATGKPIQKGVYDRLGEITKPDGTVENVGTQVGQRLRATERAINAGVLEADHKLQRIENLVTGTVPKGKLSPLANRKATNDAFSDFIDLVEKPFSDPQRIAVKKSGSPIGEALKIHDEMTEGFRQYIIDSRKGMGIDTPPDWGVTEQGYYRHLFMGDIRIFDGTKLVDTARTYAEAQGKAVEYLKKNPNAQITARGRNIVGGDPAVRISTGKYFRLVDKLSGEVQLSMADIMADLRGIVGRKAAKQKFAGFLLERKGVKGYSKAYMDVMRIHATQVFRTQELSKMNRAVIPMVEKLRSNGKPGLAAEIEGHVNDLWGTPSKFELDFGEWVRNQPVLRNHVANPAMAFRGLARRLTALQSNLKLRVSPRSAFVNLVQPFSTLWPYISTIDMAAIYGDLFKLSTHKMLIEKGVVQGSGKLESAHLTHGTRVGSALNPLGWFQKASEFNRGAGYLYGLREGKRLGLSEADTHNLGLSWAEKVEFDNSTWNVQPVLRSPQARVLGQFKSFMGKNLENVRDVVRSEGVSKPQAAARRAKWLTAQVGAGGIKSLGMAAEAAGALTIIRHLSKQMQSYGMEKQEADKWADAVYYGAPSLIGQDLSASVMILEAPYGRTMLEQAGNFVFGPTVGTAIAVGEGVKAKSTDRVIKGLTSAFKPYSVVKNTVQGKPQSIKAGSKEIPLTNYEAIMRALGFTPLKQSKYYDKPKDIDNVPLKDRPAAVARMSAVEQAEFFRTHDRKTYKKIPVGSKSSAGRISR